MPVGGDRRTEQVCPHAPPEQGHRILLDVQQRAIVVGPRDVGLRVLDHIAEQRAAGEILETDLELATADHVLRVREQAVVRADFVAAELEERLPDGERIAVEDHRFRRPRLVRPAQDQRILPAAHEAAGVPVAAIAHRHARVVLLDAADDFSVQPFDQRLHRRQHCLGIGRLGLQIGKHLRVAARVVAQPVEGILPDAMRRRYTVHEHRGARGLGHGGMRHGAFRSVAGRSGVRI